MIDLGKPYGIHEGLIFYGDHENDSIVYYLPDEIKFAQKENGDPAVYLQVFQEDKILSGGIDELRKTAGSILQLDAVCEVSPERLKKAVESVRDEFGLPKNLSPATPLWNDGSVDLITLDGSTTGSDSTFVKTVVGSARPSLGSLDLKSIFNIRFDRMGTELIYSAMKGGKGSLVGLMYDLQYTAMRPSVQLRISADLSRCQDTVRHNLDAEVQLTYYVDLSLAAQLEWLTKKMEDNGDIKVELLSTVETPEEKKIVDELVKDFKESVELFQPVPDMESTVAAKSLSGKEIADLVKTGVEALSSSKKKDDDKKDESSGKKEEETKEDGTDGQGAEAEKTELEDYLKYSEAFHIGVTYQMIDHHIEVGRKIEVDYRERSAVVKTHNPSSHLWLMKEQGGFASLDKYIDEVKLGTLWKDQEVKIQLLYNFDDPDSDLDTAEVFVWRAKDGIAANYRGEGLAMKTSTDPLDSFTFSRTSQAERPIAWLSENEEDSGYYYQVHFVYSGSLLNMVSPKEIFTPPVLSYSRNLLIQPDRTIYYKKYPIRAGALNFDEISSAEVRLSMAEAGTGKQTSQIIYLDSQHAEDRFIVRGVDKKVLPLEIEKVFHFRDGRNPVKSLTTLQVDDEIVVSNPVVEKEFVVILSGIKEGITDVLLSTVIESKEYDSQLNRTFSLSTANGAIQTVKIPFYSNSDTVKYSSIVLSSGKQVSVEGGIWKPDEPNQLTVDLTTVDQRTITVQWDGKSPEESGLKSLRVVFKDQEGNIVQEFSFKGSSAPGPVVFRVSNSIQLMFDIERRYEDGEKEKEDNVQVTSSTVVIHP